MELYRFTIGAVSTNCYIVYDPGTKEALIVDPADRADFLIGKLTELSLKPAAILLTHGHFDHMMASLDLKKQYQIPIYAAEAESALLADCQRNLTGPWGGRPMSMKADHLLTDGQKVTVGTLTFTVLVTPGHTEGSCCYYFSEDKILLCGDTLFAGSYGRTDLPGGSMSAMVRSVTRLLSELPEEVTAFPGHGDETTIGAERRGNPLAGYLR